ncbi:MAG TPA: FAD:protein FMN transferase [Pseudonocardiaceae bacterium]|nr:FAD:protein FMN transferase [Pseudonocardiaceae bacterium]
MTAAAAMTALSTTALLVVTEPAALDPGMRLLADELAAIDLAASRFRADSELSRLPAGRAVSISPLLTEALAAALRAALLTDGIVDPTVADAVSGLGYDRDFAQLIETETDGPISTKPAPGWWRIALDTHRREVLVPHGVHLDLGATAKALVADRSAERIGTALGCGVLVSLGGDVATHGPAPEGGWRIGIGDDHRTAATDPDAMVTIADGGLATSSTTVRRWRRAGRDVHHIVDPRTGDLPVTPWRTVSVAAASCLDANAASTAAIVLGDAAPDWLTERRLPARLVDLDGTVRAVGGWPSDLVGAA